MRRTRKISTKKEEYNKALISFLLRSGLAIVFFYAAISSLLQPLKWVGYIPEVVNLVISDSVFLIIFAIYQILLGMALLADYKIFLVSILSSVTLLLITLGNIFMLDIVFRDIAILFMSLALNALYYKNDA